MIDARKIVYKETAVVAIGQVLCCGAMVGIFALLDRFAWDVLWGGLAGCILSTLNFFFMAVCASLAADKAEAQNVKGGEGLIRISYFVRMILIFLILFALIRSNLCNPLAAVLPLAFTRPIITIGEFFRKSGEK